MTAAPGQPGRLYVVQQSGRIRILERGRMRGTFLDISGLVTAGGEQGLLGLAFHPAYARNGRFFVYYTDPQRRRHGWSSTAARARRAPTPGAPAACSRWTTPTRTTTAAHLAFGPDGYLYIGTGDGGSGGDPEGNGQRTDTLLGKLLRIDVNSRSSGRLYGIPAGNPYRSGGGRPEIYAYGLRNPWRFSFDRQRGDLWIGDVGQGSIEEIDFRAKDTGAGANFGWNAYEGRSSFGGSLRGGPHVPPVAQYSHSAGCSVTGGYVYRGTRVPALRGRYVYADYCSGRLWTHARRAEPGRRPRGHRPARGQAWERHVLRRGVRGRALCHRQRLALPLRPPLARQGRGGPVRPSAGWGVVHLMLRAAPGAPGAEEALRGHRRRSPPSTRSRSSPSPCSAGAPTSA